MNKQMGDFLVKILYSDLVEIVVEEEWDEKKERMISQE